MVYLRTSETTKQIDYGRSWMSHDKIGILRRNKDEEII